MEATQSNTTEKPVSQTNWKSSLWQNATLSGLAEGFCLAGIGLFWIHLLLSTWGWTYSTASSIALGLTVASLLPSRPFSRVTRLLSAGGLLLLTVCAPFWWPVAESVLSDVATYSFIILINSLLLAGLTWLGRHSVSTSNSRGLWFGATLGLWTGGFLLAVLMPVYWIATAATITLTLWQVVRRQWPVRSQPARSCSRLSTPLALSLSLFTGIAVPAVYRVICQLQPETSVLFYGSIAAFCCGIGLAHILSRRISLLTVAACLAVVLVAFPVWIQGALAISATVSQIHLIIGYRQLIVLAHVLPLGFLWGRAFAGFNTADLTTRAGLLILSALGWSLSTSLIFLLSVPATLIVSMIGIVALAAGKQWQLNGIHQMLNTGKSKLHTFRYKTYGLAAACLTVLSLPLMYQPDVAARVLFSSHTFQAWRNGSSLQELCGLDDSRLVDQFETPSGTMTIWNQRGTHLQIRENGIPTGRISADDTLVPHPSDALMSAVLPLAIHPAPRQIMLLGLDSGLGLQTALEFPLMDITCVENNSALLQQARQGVLSKALTDTINDDRIHWKTASINAAIRDKNQTFDVIIENPGHSALYRTASRFEETHYRHIAELLSEQGLYCQRITYSDYGPDVLASLARTMQKTFGYVTAFDTAPGEMLFIAAASAEDVFAEGLIKRISSPQVRRSLARVGWDWAVAMNLARFEVEDLESVTGFGAANAWKGTGSFGRAFEMMRWGHKFGEVTKVLASRPKRLLDHYADEKEVDNLLKRLSDITARDNVLKQHPDEFWVYRKSLKERLVDRPRTVIAPVKGEGIQHRMHPEEKRRIQYFETLGTATQQSPTRLASLAEVEEFAAPFDPMLSYFLHPEIAKLYQRCDPPQPDLELKHWLHAIYYGHAEERSVRGIHRALELLADAETSFTAEQRYDHINALLDLLKTRWQMRNLQGGISQPVLLIDIKDSIAMAEKGLQKAALEGKAAGLDESAMQIRADYLEKTLVRTLRSYRTELLAKASRRPSYPLPE